MRQILSWPADSPAPAFVAQSWSTRFRRGEGLPGRCWQQAAIVWTEDVLADPGFLRAESARQAGLHGAFAFPLIAGNQVLGVMEFFHRASQRPQNELAHMLTSIGNQLGEYIVRNRSELLLRQSEERFRILVQGVKEYAIFMLDPDGRVSTWNAGAERIKGYRASEIIGVHYSRFFPPEELGDDKPARKLAAATRQGQVEGEGWRVRKDGSRFWANTVITALLDEEGRLRGFAKVTRDMSDRKRLEALEEAGRHTRQFLAMLAHELRNPLAPIRNAVGVMRIRELDDQQLSACRDIIGRQVEHLSRLVDDLFDVSRITSGKVALHKRTIDVASAVTRAAECVRPFVDARQQTLEVDLPKEPIRVQGDLTRLAQVVQNLLHNSAKYTPPGGRIVLTLRTQSDTAIIRVQDDGIGIASHLLPKVFDLFVQAEGPVDCSDGGLGIGLTLVRQLVELHGGSVDASSEGPGRGAEFIVRLPCVRSSVSAATLLKENVAASELHTASGPRRILVVDDNRDSAESMALLLRLSGHTTWLAFDGPSAVSLAAEHSPDAVLLDIGLPGMDGYQVASRLRELPQTFDSLLIALTGYGQEEDRQRSTAAGFNEHFVKPVDIEALYQAIAHHQRARPGHKPL
jgi:PAS domain S-box-containing protein